MTDFEKKALLKKILILVLILFVASVVIVTLTLLFSKNYSLVGWVDALFFNGFLIFAFSWMMIVSNANLFTTAIYGVRQFISSLFGRRQEKDIIEYRDSRKSVPKHIIITAMLYGVAFMLISIVLYYITKA